MMLAFSHAVQGVARSQYISTLTQLMHDSSGTCESMQRGAGEWKP